MSMYDDDYQRRADLARADWINDTTPSGRVVPLSTRIADAVRPGLATTIGVTESNTSAVALANAVSARVMLTFFDEVNRDVLMAELIVRGIVAA